MTMKKEVTTNTTATIEIINLTPHSINFVDDGGNQTMAIEPSGLIARVTTETVVIGNIAGIPITTVKYGEVENLPEEKEDTIYIVSSIVAQRCKHRCDVFIPNDSVRDEKGRIIGCKSLARV